MFLAVRPGPGAEAAAWPGGGSDGWRAGVAGLGAGLVAFGFVALVRRRRDGGVAAARQARVPALGRVGVGGLTTLALVLLSPSATFGQTWQVVEYYDTDAIGSVRVVTDAAGAVVARHDFLPFGEELSPQTPPHDKKLFTGQERDFETGQDYFNARQLRADIGRFLSADSMRLVPRVVGTQDLNSYAYVRNNPLFYIDLDGRWPTPTHHLIVANAFPGLSQDQRDQMTSGSDWADNMAGGLGWTPVAHHQRGKDQTVVDAAQAYEHHVALYENWARHDGMSDRGFFNFGVALHAVMDANSPGHSNFEYYDIWHWKSHNDAESHISSTEMGDAILASWQAYYRVYGLEALLTAAGYTGAVPKGVREIEIECVFENGEYRMELTY